MEVKTIIPAAHMLQNIVKEGGKKEFVCLMPFRFAKDGENRLTPEIAPGDIALVLEDYIETDIKWEKGGKEISGHLVEYCSTGDRYIFSDKGMIKPGDVSHETLTYFGSRKNIPAVQMSPMIARKHILVSGIKVMKLWDVTFNDVVNMGYNTMEELANSWNSMVGKGNKWNDNPTVCRIAYKVGSQF